jgi:hypothetical protein
MTVVGVDDGEEGEKSDEGVEVHGDQGTKTNDEGERHDPDQSQITINLLL